VLAQEPELHHLYKVNRRLLVSGSSESSSFQPQNKALDDARPAAEIRIGGSRATLAYVAVEAG
jgi:hypothetical protein